MPGRGRRVRRRRADGTLRRLFARRYLDALERWHSGSDEVPPSRRLAFETERDRRCLVAQHLLLGINAHINLDLGVAAKVAAPPGELDDDFEMINDVLSELVDRTQASLATVSPWTPYVDIAGLRFDESATTCTA